MKIKNKREETLNGTVYECIKELKLEYPSEQQLDSSRVIYPKSRWILEATDIKRIDGATIPVRLVSYSTSDVLDIGNDGLEKYFSEVSEDED